MNRGSNAPPTSGQTNPYTLFGYDPCGRMSNRERRYDSGRLRSYSFLWDGDDRLRQVNERATNRFTASYDGGGDRISKTDSWSGTHNYSWGPGGLLADSSGSTTYTPGFSQRLGTADRFFQDDWLGNTRYLSDSSGNGFPKTARYTAFGERSLDWGPDPYDFSGFQFAGGFGYETEYASATEPGLGLQLLGERYYDPALGRFISQDPIGAAGGATASPTVRTIPSGLSIPPGLIPGSAGGSRNRAITSWRRQPPRRWK